MTIFQFLNLFAEKTQTFKIDMETVTIQGFTVFPVNTTPKTTPVFPTPDTMTPEMCLNTTAIVKGYHKIGMTRNTAITNGFRIDKETEFAIPIMILVGILTILQFPEYSAAGFLNYKESVDPAAKTFLGT